MYRRALGLVCLLLTTVPAVANDWEEAVLAFETQRYEDALALLAPLAEPGNVAVQLLLIDTYTLGRAMLADEAASLEWTRRGAKLGIAPAQDHMAQNYLYGNGVAADETRAAQLFELAAEQWYAPAAYNLGVMTMNGQGVAANPGYAIGLFQRAAEFDEPYALYVLGSMYLQGFYVDYDVSKSLYYLSRAAYRGQRRAMALMGIVIQDQADDPNRLVKSAFHFRRALAAGCNDISELVTAAEQRLSPEEIEMLEYNLVAWQADLQPHEMHLPSGPCLS